MTNRSRSEEIKTIDFDEEEVEVEAESVAKVANIDNAKHAASSALQLEAG